MRHCCFALRRIWSFEKNLAFRGILHFGALLLPTTGTSPIAAILPP